MSWLNGVPLNIEMNISELDEKRESEKSMFIRKATLKLKYLRAKRDEYFFIRKMFNFFTCIYYVVPFIRKMGFQCLQAYFKLCWNVSGHCNASWIIIAIRWFVADVTFFKRRRRRSNDEHETWPMPFTICSFHHLESCTIDLLSSSNDEKKQMKNTKIMKK